MSIYYIRCCYDLLILMVFKKRIWKLNREVNRQLKSGASN